MQNNTPWWFYLVAVLAVLWNVGGVMDFTMTLTENEAYLSSYTPSQIAYFLSFPLWANIAWAVGVFGAFIGSLLLLFKSKLACQIYAFSIVGMIISFAYQFLADAPEDLFTPEVLVFTVVIWVIAFLLLWFSRRMRAQHILT